MNKYFDKTDVTFFKITFTVGAVITLLTWYIV